MSKILQKIVLLSLLMIICKSSYSQINRRDSKKSVPYRNNYQRISSGNSYHHIEIREGTLWGWGWNNYGQLGTGDTINKKSPIQIGFDNNWVTVSTGFYHSLAIKANGTLWAWGRNEFGQIGDGTYLTHISPIQIGVDSSWISVTAGRWFSFGIKANGTIWAWGQNSNGQLGDSSTNSKNTPIQIGTNNDWVKIVAGDNCTIGLKSDGTLWGWGWNTYGQLGDGTQIDRNFPVQIGTSNNWTSVSAIGYHAIGLMADGSLWSWGNNSYGELGDGSTINKSNPTRIGNENNWVSIASGVYTSHALKSDGSLWCWGRNDFGQLADGTINLSKSPIRIGNENNWVSISAGNSHCIGVKAQGTIYGWGYNEFGQLGLSDTLDRNIPFRTSVKLDVWLKTVNGSNHTLGLKSDGTIWGWGKNSNGQLGDSIFIDKKTIKRIGLDSDWVDIVAGGDFSMGLKSNGTLWAWGFNGNGNLGDGTNIQKNIPTQVGSENNWSFLSAGDGFSFALKANGTLWAWGNNSYGYLGDGTTTQRKSPIQVGNDSNWVNISGGAAHSLGIKADGSIWAWGHNLFGQLGNGNTTNQLSPIQSIGSNWISIQAGSGYSFGLRSDGTLWAWGWNNDGELGDNSNTQRNSPIKIAIKDIISLSAGSSVGNGGMHSFSIKADGTLWAWGYNYFGQLGLGDTINYKIPTKVNTSFDWISISSDGQHSVGLKSDRNKFCSSGFNLNGQLGDGSTIDKYYFMCNTNSNCTPNDTSLYITSCDKYTFKGNDLTQTGIYYDTLSNINGCDSVVALNLTIYNSTQTNITTLAYNSYIFKGNPYTNSGIYYDSLSTSHGCDSVVKLTLTIIKTKIDTIVQTNVTCFGDNNGTATVTASGGHAPYTYRIGNGNYQTSNVFTNLVPGNYTITARDTNGCISSKNITITQPSALQLSFTYKNLLCYNDSDGRITLNASGGVGNYQYKLNNGNYQTSNVFNNLVAGNYTVNIKDSNNCQIDTSIYIYQPSALAYSTVIKNVSCYGDSNASITINPTGGVGAYQYKINTNNYQSQHVFSGLKAGTYTVYLKDSNGCEKNFQVNITQPAKLRIINALSVPTQNINLMCYGDSTGEISVQITGGTSPFKYYLPATQSQSSNQFSGLKSGYYLTTVQDTNGCIDTTTYYIDQALPILISSKVTLPLCNGDSSGSITFAANQGYSPYMYKLNQGSYQNTSIFNHLKAGVYNITVMDANGCISQKSVTLGQPAVLSIIDTVTHVKCKGNTDGSITVYGQGGKQPYMYKLGNGNFTNNNLFNQLGVGTYTIYMKDSNNCITSKNIQITEPSNYISYTSNTSYINCAGNSGIASILASGGTAPYTYKLGTGNYQSSNQFTGLSAGKYLLTIQDTNGCIYTDSLVMPANNIQLAISLSKINVCCDGTNTGEIAVNLTGGTQPYMYQIGTSAFQTVNKFVVGKGSYIITAKDSNNCSISAQTTIYEPAQMVSNIIWTGSVDTVWTNKNNWNLNRIPTNTDTVLIPTGKPRYPTIAANTPIQGLIIEAGAEVRTITAGTLQIKGAVTGNGSIIMNGGVFKLSANTGLPQGNYHSMVLEGAIKMCGNITLKHSFNMNTGYSLDTRGYNINTIGDVINSGVIKGGGKLILEKGNGYQTLQGDATYSCVELNNPNNMGVRFGSNITVTDTLKLIRGTLVIYQYKTLVVGSISSDKGYIQTLAGNIISGNSLPSNLSILGNAQSAKLTNLKVQVLGNLTVNRPSGVVFGDKSSAAGLNLSSGVIDMNGYDFTLGKNGSNLAITTSDFITNSQNTGKLQINGDVNSQVISNLKLDTMYQLYINNVMGVSLGKSTYIRSLVNIGNGWVDLNGYQVTLSPTASLSEIGNGMKFKGNSGYITTTRTYTAALANNNIAGMGLKLSTNNNPGVTTINRGHTVYTSGTGKSIARYFDVTTANNVNATNFELIYDSTELNGANRSKLRINQSVNGGAAWTNIVGCSPSTANTSSGSVNKTNVGLSSTIKFTLSDSINTPLSPVYIVEQNSNIYPLNMEVYPNPFTSDFNIDITTVKGIYTIQLIDISGRAVATQTITTTAGNTIINIPTETLAKGIYMLSITSDTENKTVRVVKQ